MSAGSASKPHGHPSRYRSGCPCRPCKDGYAEYMRERRAAGHNLYDRAYGRAREMLVRRFRAENPQAWQTLLAECRAQVEAERAS